MAKFDWTQQWVGVGGWVIKQASIYSPCTFNFSQRSNMPGVGYRSTGRNNLGLGTPGGTNGHPIFLNAELKHVLTNNSRKNRGNNSLTMPLSTQQQIGQVHSVAKSINTPYNLRSNSNSPTNANSSGQPST